MGSPRVSRRKWPQRNGKQESGLSTRASCPTTHLSNDTQLDPMSPKDHLLTYPLMPLTKALSSPSDPCSSVFPFRKNNPALTLHW